MKMHLKKSSGKQQPFYFCLCLSVLKQQFLSGLWTGVLLCLKMSKQPIHHDVLKYLITILGHQLLTVPSHQHIQDPVQFCISIMIINHIYCFVTFFFQSNWQDLVITFGTFILYSTNVAHNTSWTFVIIFCNEWMKWTETERLVSLTACTAPWNFSLIF